MVNYTSISIYCGKEVGIDGPDGIFISMLLIRYELQGL